MMVFTSFDNFMIVADILLSYKAPRQVIVFDDTDGLRKLDEFLKCLSSQSLNLSDDENGVHAKVAYAGFDFIFVNVDKPKEKILNSQFKVNT